MQKVLRFKATRLPPVLKYVLHTRQWQRANPTDPDFDLFWKNGRFSREEMKNSAARYNHFTHTHWITRKGHLQNLLKLCYLHYGDCYNFTPRSWVFTTQSKNIILDYEKRRQEALPPSEHPLWIGKPSDSSRGRGIIITKDLSSFLSSTSNLSNQETDMVELLARQNGITPTPAGPPQRPPQPLIVVQEYIRNPLLVSSYKFDLRLYVLVKSFHPLEAHLFGDGLARFCTKPYTEEDLDPLRHLTNSSIQQHVLNFKLITSQEEDAFNAAINAALGPGDFSKRSIRSLFAYFYRSGIDYQLMWHKIINVINLTLLSLLPSLPQVRNSCFELLGFDILITADGTPMLVEVNMGPSLAVTCPVDQMVKQPLMEDMLDIVFGPQAPRTQKPLVDIIPPTEFNKNRSQGDFRLIFPFSKSSEREAAQIALGLNTEERVKKIIQELLADQSKRESLSRTLGPN